MAGSVAEGLFCDRFLQFLGEVHACLVGQADEHPQHVGHLLAKVWLLARLEALVTVFAGDDTR